MTQTIINLGTGGAVLNGRNGSTTSADSNDALFLDWPGDNGGNYVYNPNVSNNYVSVPDAVNLQITGDIDLRFYGAADVWGFAGNVGLVNKSSAAVGNRGARFTLQSNGALRLLWSENGTDDLTATSPALTNAAGSALWVRVTLDVDNGAGGYDVKFFTSNDGVTWTQFGSTITGGATTSIFASTQEVNIARLTTAVFGGKVYRAEIWDGIEGSGGTKVLDVDTSVITSGAATTFTALTGQTVTINRSTAGRKAVAVVSPVWLFGTDDYMEVADNDLLDFGATDSFTVVAAYRKQSTPATFGAYVSKWPGAGNAGWALINSTTTVNSAIYINDATTAVNRVGGNGAFGTLTVDAGVVDRGSQLSYLVTNGVTGSTSSIASVGNVSNSGALRVGRNSITATAYQDFELVAVAVFRRALTAAEISAITAYYQARLS